MTGLTQAQLEMITSVLSRYKDVTGARLYGSRAKGNFTSRSDIDLALLGEIDRHTLSAIALDLDESDLPHAVDVLCLAHLRNRALIDHIQRVGVEIYAK